MIFLATLLGGAAVKFAAQRNAANRREDIAELNFGIATNNAELSRDRTLTGLKLNRVADKINLDASRTNLRLAISDAEARKRNAERLRLFAEAKTKQSREAIRRQMRSFEEFQSSQSAAVGASGTTMSGSAMEVLLESAEQFKMQIEDMNEQASFERSNTLQDAAIEEIGAGRDATKARAEFGFAKRGARMARKANRLGRISAKTAFQSALMEAEVDRLSQNDTAQGQRLGATAGALGALGSYAVRKYDFNQNSPT